jgi:hypothetical protein
LAPIIPSHVFELLAFLLIGCFGRCQVSCLAFTHEAFG